MWVPVQTTRLLQLWKPQLLLVQAISVSVAQENIYSVFHHAIRKWHFKSIARVQPSQALQLHRQWSPSSSYFKFSYVKIKNFTLKAERSWRNEQKFSMMGDSKYLNNELYSCILCAWKSSTRMLSIYWAVSMRYSYSPSNPGRILPAAYRKV